MIDDDFQEILDRDGINRQEIYSTRRSSAPLRRSVARELVGMGHTHEIVAAVMKKNTASISYMLKPNKED